MKRADAGAKDPENRSDKACCCGGHNANNPKRNLNHHGTYMRHLIRQCRQRTFAERQAETEFYDTYYTEGEQV